ncbi:MAG: hypothetical protein ACP5HM_08995 [Anaerolineae bacterium]
MATPADPGVSAGCAALGRVLTALTPEQALEEIETSGLRGLPYGA